MTGDAKVEGAGFANVSFVARLLTGLSSMHGTLYIGFRRAAEIPLLQWNGPPLFHINIYSNFFGLYKVHPSVTARQRLLSRSS